MSKFFSINPATKKKLGEIHESTSEEIERKVSNAQTARDGWRALGLKGRISLLTKLLGDIKHHSKELALLSTREMGMPIRQSEQDVTDALRYFDWYLVNAEKYLSPEITNNENGIVHRVFYEPIGVAAVIVPWNFPVSNFVWGVIPNLLVGNTVVFKDSEETPLIGKFFEDIVSNSGLPNGVFSEVYGDGKVGDLLVHENVNLIWFTGSTKVGKYLYKVAADKLIKIVMELGGSAPGIVFSDVNVDDILDTIFYARFVNCGQVCDGLKRLIVHESRFDTIVNKLKAKLQSVKVGNPEDSATDIGPLVAKRQLDLLEGQVKDAVDKGAEVVIGGKRADNLTGYYYEPTVLTNVNRDMRVWREEVFGPVLPIVSFKTDDEAVKLANDTRYGLGSYIFTSDSDKADSIAARIESGMVAVNNASYLVPFNPFGGFKESGIGREHGKYGFHELCQLKVVSQKE